MGAFADAFAEQLKSAVTKAETKGTHIAHTAVYFLARDVIENSPVQMPDRWYKNYKKGPAGHYKNNWQIGINIEPENDIPGGDITGTQAESRALNALFSNMKLGKKTIHLVNNAKSISVKKNGPSMRTMDIEDEGTVLSQLESYALAIEDGIGFGRDTWAYQLADAGVIRPGAVLGRAKGNWGTHLQNAKEGKD
jgi:hypothetical protein